MNVQTAQAPFELQTLLSVVADLRPTRILEIGVWHGGTLRHWIDTADRVVAVDNLMLEAATWVRWADDANTDLFLFHGDSHDPSVIERVEELGPFDFAFIDAGHTYDEVKRDWDNYRPMVAGAVAFHDIMPRDGYGVDRLWREIKSEPGARTIEILQQEPFDCPDLTPGYAPGIGIAWV